MLPWRQATQQPASQGAVHLSGFASQLLQRWRVVKCSVGRQAGRPSRQTHLSRGGSGSGARSLSRRGGERERRRSGDLLPARRWWGGERLLRRRLPSLP